MILLNYDADLSEFVRLNEAWISKYFALEEADHRLANAPWKVIEDGGYIFSLLEGSCVVGTCALFKENDDEYQLARMAVAAEYQGRGYGDRLMIAVMQKLAEIQAKRVYLLSNTTLKAAMGLYRKHGFQVLAEGAHPVYTRVDIVMEKWLDR